MKKIVVLLILAGLIAGGVAGYRMYSKRLASNQPTTHVTAVVKRGTIDQAVESSGKVVSNLDVDIKCRASGEVTQLPFDVSQTVKTGDLLAQLDPADEEIRVRQAEALLNQALARLEQTKSSLTVAEQDITTSKAKAEATLASMRIRSTNAKLAADRQRDLLGQNLSAQQDVETAQTEAAQADADLRLAEAQIEAIKTQEVGLEVKRQDIKLADSQVSSNRIALDDARQQLAYTTVVAPIDGVVASLNVQKGTIISSGISNVGGGTTIMTLSDLSHVFVLAAVDESDIGKIAADQQVDVSVDAFPDRQFAGKVVRIATKGLNVSNVVTFEVKIEVLDKDKSLLKPEMTANVRIIQDRRENALVVPAGAVLREGDHAVITVSGVNGKPEKVVVTTGLSDGESMEITGGLTDGQTVVVDSGQVQSRWRKEEP